MSSRPASRRRCASSAKASHAASTAESAEQATNRVTLPGTLSVRDEQWWWEVQLPGEGEVAARALIAAGAETGTKDLETARQAALQLWEQALSGVVERRVRAEGSETVARLKAQFMEKVRDFSHIVETTQARLEAETQARSEAEAKLAALGDQVAATVTCECCETPGIAAGAAKRIDSGQLLCPDCLAALRAEVERIEADVPAPCSA
jgi:hypothetical protein